MKNEAKITPTEKQSKAPSVEKLTNAAWHIAHAALWWETRFSASEILRAKKHITAFLNSKNDPQIAFKEFTERILIANRFFATATVKYVDKPSVWFYKDYMQGFDGTFLSYVELMLDNMQNPGSGAGIFATTQFYCDYIRCPSKKIVRECRNHLLETKEYGLLQVFFNTIINRRYIYPTNKVYAQASNNQRKTKTASLLHHRSVRII